MANIQRVAKEIRYVSFPITPWPIFSSYHLQGPSYTAGCLARTSSSSTRAELQDSYLTNGHRRILDVHLHASASCKCSRICSRVPSVIDKDVTCANRFGVDFLTAFLPYGPEWRTHRRIFHQAMKLETVELYQNLYRAKAMKLVRRLLDTPGDFENHIRLLVAVLCCACC